MAGYIFSLDNENALYECIKNGVYSTNLKKLNKEGLWRTHHEGTMADYLGMKEGDNVYFFIKRKIYGIGELVNIDYDCKFLNYINADKPYNYNFEKKREELLWGDSEENLNNRLICTFKPKPNFFRNGIDMDDILELGGKNIKILRAFWKLSFIKVDEIENFELKSIILRKNEEFIDSKDFDSVFEFSDKTHNKITDKITRDYEFNYRNIIDYCSDGNYVKHEMALEAALVNLINKNEINLLGNWDYISHQVIASPFKAIDYMDKIDLFGYKYLEGYKIISKYLVVEIKKDIIDKNSVQQLMKYVDWINNEYANKDYSMIEAFLVGHKIKEDALEYKNNYALRNYTIGRRPFIEKVWNNIRFIEYEFDYINKNLIFKEIKKD
ncbi:hypothetical protein WG909_02075 [Peptostreptococcaceae bacterium AGR-M142]